MDRMGSQPMSITRLRSKTGPIVEATGLTSGHTHSRLKEIGKVVKWGGCAGFNVNYNFRRQQHATVINLFVVSMCNAAILR